MSILFKQCSENAQIFIVMWTKVLQLVLIQQRRFTVQCSYLNITPGLLQLSLKLTHGIRFFFTFLNSVSGQLQLHHINTFKSTGQKCSFCLGNQLQVEPDLKSAVDSVEPGSCSDPSQQMWVESPVHWEIKQWMVLFSLCCSVFHLTKV